MQRKGKLEVVITILALREIVNPSVFYVSRMSRLMNLQTLRMVLRQSWASDGKKTSRCEFKGSNELDGASRCLDKVLNVAFI